MIKRKVFISQPLKGKTKEQAKKERSHTVEVFNKNGYEVIESILPEFMLVENDRENLKGLAKAIELLANADYVYFMPGWSNSRGCVIEHLCSIRYNIPLIKIKTKKIWKRE